MNTMLSATDLFNFLSRAIPALKGLHISALTIELMSQQPVVVRCTVEPPPKPGKGGGGEILAQEIDYELRSNGQPVSSDEFMRDFGKNFAGLERMLIRRLMLRASREAHYDARLSVTATAPPEMSLTFYPAMKEGEFVLMQTYDVVEVKG